MTDSAETLLRIQVNSYLSLNKSRMEKKVSKEAHKICMYDYYQK